MSVFLFVQQKTAYEMRISDWSFRRVLFRSYSAVLRNRCLWCIASTADRCILALNRKLRLPKPLLTLTNAASVHTQRPLIHSLFNAFMHEMSFARKSEIGRASGGEGGCQYG